MSTKSVAISILSAFDIPLSAIPFLYKKVLPEGRESYRPFYRPWLEDSDFQNAWEEVRKGTTSREESCYYLKSMATYASFVPGDFFECGVYKGGTAILLAQTANQQGKRLHLFDTFEGMPEQSAEHDFYKIGDFADTSLESVKRRLKQFENIAFNKGFIPDTFKGYESSQISFAHIDVDQYVSTQNCLEFIYPRMARGGVVVIDDYGKPGTPGSKRAADGFVLQKEEYLTSLPTGQAFFIKQRG